MKEPYSISVSDADGESAFFKIRQLITNIPIDDDSEFITVISTYQANLYVGTSLGQIFHYHKFEDAAEYFLISQLSIGNEKASIKKMLILPAIERTLILCGDTVYVRTLPELSTCSIGKFKETNYISQLTQLNKNSNSKNNRPSIPNEKIIVFNNDKIRLIQFNPDSMKLLKEIHYSNARKGISCSSGTSANYSNLCLVANEKNYDIVDLQQTRKIPLFEYDSSLSANIQPFIIPLSIDDTSRSQEEYLLTVSSDQTTSIAMFISSLGDVTRGTISWINKGYPQNGLVSHWPYVIGVFKAPETDYCLVFSSLESLTAIKTINIKDIVSRAPKESRITEEIDTTTLGDITQGTSDDSGSQPEKIAGTKRSDIEKNEQATDDTQSYKICESNDEILFDNTELTLLLSRSMLLEKSTSEVKYSSKGNIFFFNNKEICLLHQEESILVLHNDVKSSLDDPKRSRESLENLAIRLEKAYKLENSHRREYLFLLTLLVLLVSKAFDKIENKVYKDEVDGALLDPRFFLYALKIDDTSAFYDDFEVFSGLKCLVSRVREMDLANEAFLSFLLKESYARISSLQQKPSVVAHLRTLLYTTQVRSSHDLIRLVCNDEEFWTSLETNKVDILKYVESNEYYLGLFFIYKLQQYGGKPNESLAIKICDLTIKMLKKDIRDDAVSVSGSGTETVGDQPLNLVESAFRELSDNFNDTETYTKYLLEMLRLCPQEGINYLKANKNIKHKSTHKNILDDMSKFYKGDLEFGTLKIEYLESILVNELNSVPDISIDVIDDLLFELTRCLVSDAILNESSIANFQILKETFKIEHSLTDAEWPKTAWIDFLFIVKDRSECSAFLKVYLKVYELLLFRYVKHGLKESHDFIEIREKIIEHNDILGHLCILVSELKVTDVIAQLSQSFDYSTAEYFILFKTLPLPSRPYFIENQVNQLSSLFKPRNDVEVREDLKVLFQLYMGSDERNGQILAARHFIFAYARTYFGPLEIIELLPSFLPLPYIKEYLQEILISSEALRREAVLKKVMNRTESKFNERIYKSLKPADKDLNP